MSTALETTKLSKRYGRTWALQDCTLSLPAGRVAALIGPNGAGYAAVQGLYGRGAADAGAQAESALARARMQKLGIPLNRRAGKLSGGQQAQVALVLALAKRPDLLLLDEPLSSLDPLARREFLRTLMDAVAESGLTVLLSSHIIGDLERVCHYLVILSASQVQLAGDMQEIQRTHKRLIGPRQDEAALASVHTVIEASHTDRQTTLLVRTNGPLFAPSWEVQEVSMEDMVLAYLSQQAGDRVPAPPSAREQDGREVFQ
jgi:ABC-type multidrug transport system ATPase subunit